MSAHRFFLEAPLPRAHGAVVLPLDADDLRHAVLVLRIRQSEKIEVVEPSGQAWVVEVEAAAKDGVVARVLERLEDSSLPDVTLLQGVAKGEKMDALIRQAVEIGVSEIRPVITARSVVKLDERKRAERGERWRRIAKAAAEQAHRSAVPRVADPVPFAKAVSALDEFDVVLLLWEEAHVPLASYCAALRVPDVRVAVFVGPEGGFEVSEVDDARSAGARVASLGGTVLRTETAAVVASAIAIHLMGGLGGQPGDGGVFEASEPGDARE